MSGSGSAVWAKKMLNRSKTMGRSLTRGLFGAVAITICLSAQVLSPAAGAAASSGKRQVRIVTLSRYGFEPPQIGVRKGAFTIILRDLTGSLHAPAKLHKGSKSGDVVDAKQRSGEWKLMEEMAFDLPPGDYFLGVSDSRDRSLKIIVAEK